MNAAFVDIHREQESTQEPLVEPVQGEISRHARGVLSRLGETEIMLALSLRDVSSLTFFEKKEITRSLQQFRTLLDSYERAIHLSNEAAKAA